MSVTTGEAIAAVRSRLNAGSYSFPVYYQGDDAPDLPDTPATFAYVVFNNEGSNLVAFGGGRGESIYRNRARVEAFVFSPIGEGMEKVADYAETIAVRLRSYRDDSISCFSSDVIPIGPGATLSVPGLNNEVNNYQCALVESILYFDQTGGAVVDASVSDWVPASVKIHIDLVGGTPQGRAWVDGTGEVAVDTLLGSDPNTEGGWSATEYDPADLTSNGLVPSSVGPALIGVALAEILDAATIRIQIKQVEDIDVSGFSESFILLSANGADAIEFDLIGGMLASVSSWNGPLNNSIPDSINSGLGSVNALAVTLTASRADIAVNGFAAIAGGLVDADRPVANPLVAALIDVNGPKWAIQSITIYDPLPTAAGLSELSSIT